MTEQALTPKQFLEAQGGTVVNITVDGIDYLAAGYLHAGEVDLHTSTGDLLANATFDDDTESAQVSIEDDEGFGSSDLYFEHSGKMEFDLAEDVGSYLAAVICH